MALTSKKRAFVDALRRGASNKDAAIAAGYAASSASQAGARLAKDPHVLAELGRKPVNRKVKADLAPEATTPTPENGEPAEHPGFDLDHVLTHKDPKDFLMAVMNDFESDAKLRVDAAKALMPFIHSRKGESGKKDLAKDAAAQAAAGRFGVRQPPKLTAVKVNK